MALESLLCSGNDASQQHWSVLRAIQRLHTPKNHICLLGKSSPIKQRCQSGAQGLIWGARGQFLQPTAMVGREEVVA
jgi:hypothetical protein